MLAERYFPLESKRYRSISRVFNRLNPSFFASLALLYSIWTIFLSGSSVSYRVLTDNDYWHWSSFNIFSIFSLILIGLVEIKYLKQSNDSSLLKSFVFNFFNGYVLFILGTSIVGITSPAFFDAIFYVLYFSTVHIVWSMPLNIEKKLFPKKSESIKILFPCLVLMVAISIYGFWSSDPYLATASGLYIPFYLVAILLPNAIRHYQRLRIFGVAIPVFFIGVHFPWFLVISILIFWVLRYYNYFSTGTVLPSFKVIDPSIQKKKNG